MNKEKKIKVAIQGARGSFHELAGIKHFGDNIQIMECVTFKNVFDSVINGEAAFGITAIENTVAGTILPNYAMLRESGVKIIGEVYLHIQQNLLALKGQTIEDIKEVHSHPMAIMQCQNFFEKHQHIKLIEADDTASRAKWIFENKLKAMGAIAGIHVAKMYNLQILSEGIETHKKNFTRFLVITCPLPGSLSQWERDGVRADKATACFNVSNKKGSLAKVLTKLAAYDINLSKIQSLPVIGKEWEYYIHVDMEFENYSNYKKALEEIMPSLNEFKILGEYKRGNKTDGNEATGNEVTNLVTNITNHS
ncbi:MAG: prephenate dehydratase [Bacteroidetes bacterium]|nr:prephenate dehydratase [Bacteroidota bacterium]